MSLILPFRLLAYYSILIYIWQHLEIANSHVGYFKLAVLWDVFASPFFPQA